MQKKQYDKNSHPASVKVGDAVFVKVQPKFKLDHNYHGPYRVYEVTETNAKVKPVNNPNVEERTVSLQHVSKCKDGFLMDQSWFGANVSQPRRQRKVRKQNTGSSTNNNPGPSNQPTQPTYRTRYGRTVKPVQ